MVINVSAFAKIHYKLTLSLYCTPVTCFLRENVGGSEKSRLVCGSGGSEKNRLITGADVRTGEHWSTVNGPLVNGFVDDALRDAGPCVNEALLQVDCVTDRRLLQTLLHQAANAVIDCPAVWRPKVGWTMRLTDERWRIFLR